VPVTEAAMSTQEGRATLSKQFGFDPAKVEQVVAKNIATAQQDSTKTPAPNKPLPTISIRYKVNHNGVASELVLVHTTIGSGATRQVGKGTGKKLSREWLQQSLEKSSPEVRKQLESYVKLAENPEYELYVQPLERAGKVKTEYFVKQLDSSILSKPRIDSANKIDTSHAFNDIIDNYTCVAEEFKISTKGPGGQISRTSDLFQIEGSLNGKNGVFEWIVDQGNVTHRFFIDGGIITGLPNQTQKR